MNQYDEKILLTKIFCLNENVKFPLCSKCKNELSPYRIETNSLVKLNIVSINKAIENKILFPNFISKDAHLIFICKYCYKEV